MSRQRVFARQRFLLTRGPLDDGVGDSNKAIYYSNAQTNVLLEYASRYGEPELVPLIEAFY